MLPLPPARRWSLAQRVSLLLFVVLASIVTTFGVAAYGEVRATTARLAAERLSMVAREAAAGAVRSNSARLGNLSLLATRSARVMAARSASGALSAGAIAELDSILDLTRRPADSTVVARELWTPDQRRLYQRNAPTSADSIVATTLRQAVMLADSAIVSPFYVVGERAHVAIATPVGTRADRQGVLLEWVKVGGSAQTERVLSALLTGPARVLLTSEGSDVWLGSLGRPVDPPFDTRRVHLTVDTTSDHTMSVAGTDMIVGAATVRGTPWRVVLMQSEETVLSRPRALGRRFALIALLLTMAATFVVWRVSRHMNRALEAQNLALAEANEAKARFLGIMSHELRTPLNAIAGHTELIALGIHGPVAPAQAHALERIQRNQHQLLHLVNDLLLFARVDSQAVAVAHEPVRLQEQFDELLANHLHEFERKQIALHIEPTAQVVMGDAVRVQQVLSNLITNAWRFTETGGYVRVAAISAGAGAEVIVQDNGIGIASEDLATIFEPFVQVDSSRTRRGGGAGLGLAIVRALVEAMQGQITVESAEGGGTTFRIWMQSAPPVLPPVAELAESARQA